MENIVQPKTGQVYQNVSSEAHRMPVEESLEEKGSGIEPEPKNPNTVSKDVKPVRFSDGGFKEWNWSNLPLTEEPLWQLTRKTLGLTDSEASQYQNEIGDLAKEVLEYLQDDDQDKMYKFIKEQIRRTPRSGNVIFNLIRQIQLMKSEVSK